MDLLISERQVVTREVRGGYYQPTAYLLSKLTLDASECGWWAAGRARSSWQNVVPAGKQQQQQAGVDAAVPRGLAGTGPSQRARRCRAPVPPPDLSHLRPAHVAPLLQCCCVCCLPSGISSLSTTWPASRQVRRPVPRVLPTQGRRPATRRCRCGSCAAAEASQAPFPSRPAAAYVSHTHTHTHLLPGLPLLAGAAYAAAYCLILVTFSCVVGAMSMCITSEAPAAAGAAAASARRLVCCIPGRRSPGRLLLPSVFLAAPACAPIPDGVDAAHVPPILPHVPHLYAPMPPRSPHHSPTPHPLPPLPPQSCPTPRARPRLP